MQVAAASPAPAPPAAATTGGGILQREEHLTFLNSKGERLVGVLLDTGSTDVVLLAHGYVANSSMCQFPRLAERLAEAGISSFRFDHPCAVYSRSERHGPMLMGNHEDEVADMACAVDFQRSRGKRVVCLLGHRCAVVRCIVGHTLQFPGLCPSPPVAHCSVLHPHPRRHTVCSKGGTNSVMFASRHHGVPKIVNLAGRFKCRCVGLGMEGVGGREGGTPRLALL